MLEGPEFARKLAAGGGGAGGVTGTTPLLFPPRAPANSTQGRGCLGDWRAPC